MKRKFSFISLAISLLMMSSCGKEQSQLTMESIVGRATITGKVVYNEGAKKLDDETIVHSNIMALTAQTVVVKVPYTDYDEGAVGTKYFETTTDENGYYTISIPVGATAANAIVEVKPFTASFYEVLNGEVLANENALFNNSFADDLILNIGDIKVCNVEVTATSELPNDQRTLALTVAGEVTAVCERKVNDVITANGNMDLNCKAILQISNKNSEVGDDRIIEYPVNVRNGEFEINTAFYNNWAYTDVKLTLYVNEYFERSSFIHYYTETAAGDIRTQSISGLYSMEEAITYDVREIHQEQEGDVIIPLMVASLEFRPLNIRSDIYGIGNVAADYSSDNSKKYNYNDYMDWASGSYWY